jgi:hypothetical protein
MSVLGLLIFLLIACVLIWAAQQLLAAFGVGDPIRTVVLVLIVIVVLFAFLSQTGLGPRLGIRLY